MAKFIISKLAILQTMMQISVGELGDFDLKQTKLRQYNYEKYYDSFCKLLKLGVRNKQCQKMIIGFTFQLAMVKDFGVIKVQRMLELVLKDKK